MSFPYNKILLIGATSGIGHSLASKFVKNDVHVIAVGRRRDRLDEFLAEHGSDKASAQVFDITQLDSIPGFAAEIAEKHPDLDAVFLSSGIQLNFDFSKPETVKLADYDLEWKTNYTAHIHLTTAFLPFLQKQQRKTAIIYVSSGLALVPSPRVPGYSATKAALHHFILSLREQLKTTHSHLKIIEIFPPAVQTELHGTSKQARSFGMPLQEFTDATWDQLVQGYDQPAVGFSKVSFDRFESARQAAFGQLAQMQRNQDAGNGS